MLARRASLLSIAIALGCLIAAWGLYLLTGGLRITVIEITAPVVELPEPEYLELRLLYQNAPVGGTVDCRWSSPNHEKLTETLSLEAGDGEVSFRLSGNELPPGRHQIQFLCPGEAILATETLYLPLRPFEFHPQLTWQPDGLRAEVTYRHAGAADSLRAEWFFNGEPLPEAAATVVLEESYATVCFYLTAAVGIPLPDGHYELALFHDDLFLSRLSPPPH